jgi:hypothetical protein
MAEVVKRLWPTYSLTKTAVEESSAGKRKRDPITGGGAACRGIGYWESIALPIALQYAKMAGVVRSSISLCNTSFILVGEKGGHSSSRCSHQT